MYILIIAIHVVACIILIAAILLQSGRGGGLAGLFGEGATQTIFGTRASTFLTRSTTVAAVAFLLTCISLTVVSSKKTKSLMSAVQEAEQAAPEPLAQSSEENVRPIEETEEEKAEASETQSQPVQQ